MPDKKSECLLFLSWQSDRKDCRNFVSSVIDKLPNKVSELANIIIDRDTVNVPGSPDIGDTIFEKIDQCDLVSGDITLINDKNSGCRRTPNPNVMIELGYAIKTLSWERIVLLQCKDYGDVEELPFDINHRRICNFTLGLDAETEEEKTKKKHNSKKQVLENISETVKILMDKHLLFGGKKENIPKFEITLQAGGYAMKELIFKFKNVSSAIISNLQSQDMYVLFGAGGKKDIEGDPKFKDTSLMPGAETSLNLNNQILGYGPGYTNAEWCNIDLHWQFSCEGEDGTEYWYEMSKHIDDANKFPGVAVWPVKYIG